MAVSKRRWGLDWPENVPDPFIDLVLAKKHRFAPFRHGNLLDPWEHLLRGATALLPRDVFSVNPWVEEIARDWCLEDFSILLGCASSGKSNAVGLFAVLDWIVDPHDTYIIMASTSKEMLKVRTYEAVVRYHKLLRQSKLFLLPGRESKQTTAILNEEDAEAEDGPVTTVKASIRGVAVQEGSVADARAGIQGGHMPWVTLVADELSGMGAKAEAVLDARVNLSIGTKRFRFVAMANPESVFDPACRHAVPWDPETKRDLGWTADYVDRQRWRSRFGSVLHFDGFRSPAVLEEDGAAKYPYLINQRHIDSILAQNDGNQDAPAVWTMIRGFPPPQGLESTFLTPTMLQTFHAREEPVWDMRGGEGLVTVAGLDPAFTTDGDACILQFAQVGWLRDGPRAIAFEPAIVIPILASSPRPVSYQIVDRVRLEMERRGVSPRFLACDDSGTQSVADILTAEFGAPVLRVNSGAAATEELFGAEPAVPAKERFANRGTELWARVAFLCQQGQLRRLQPRAAQQFCLRRASQKAGRSLLEPKKAYKKRLAGQPSPDDADATALCCWAAYEVAGLAPGRSELPELRSWPQFQVPLGRGPLAGYRDSWSTFSRRPA
jgi:hypothetical protein